MLRLETLLALSAPGVPGTRSEDWVGVSPDRRTAWIIDGATGVTDVRVFASPHSDASWFAEALSNALQFTADTSIDVRGTIRLALRHVREQARRCGAPSWTDVPIYAVPSATLLLVAIDRHDRFVETAWVGDCVGLRRRRGRVVPLGSSAPRPFQGVWRPTCGDIDVTADGLRRDRAKVLLDGRLSASLLALPKLIRRRVTAVAEGDEILLMTDGFFRLVYPFRLTSQQDLFDQVVPGARRLLGTLRRHEAGSNHPLARVKRHDDASALLLKVRL
jgi:hypothetical protein